MKTTLPALPYNPMGFIWAADYHSSAYSKDRSHPRTDLKHDGLLPWTTFEQDIECAINTCMAEHNIHPGTEIDVGVTLKERRLVNSEEIVRAEAMLQLHDLVVEVLRFLGIQNGRFESPGGNNQVIGEPDFSWLHNSKHPKVVVEYKTIWTAGLENLRENFLLNPSDRTVSQRQSIEALQQLYGYMTFNDNKYGILTNWERAWFFQRVETPDSRGKTLHCYGPVALNANSGPSMLKAFVGIILLADAEANWFHTSPTICNSPRNRHFNTLTLTGRNDRDRAILKVESYHPTAMNGSYPIIELDPRLCRFDRSFVRHTPQRGFTVKATLMRGGIFTADLPVFCKIIDLAQRGDSLGMLDTEMQNYAILQHLQGQVIPRVRGYYNVWGLLRLLALDDVGTAIPEYSPISATTRRRMGSALARIHAEGYVHGDLERRNFCKTGTTVFLVDLESLKQGTPDEMVAELAQLAAL